LQEAGGVVLVSHPSNGDISPLSAQVTISVPFSLKGL